MKTNPRKPFRPGYASILMVLAIGGLLAALTLYSYKRASQSREVENQVQLRLDYSEKEEAALRAVIALVPNRAIRAMKQDSAADPTFKALRWNNIFSEALADANARTSIPNNLKNSLGIPDLITANTGDSGLNKIKDMFSAIGSESGFVSEGTGRSLGSGYPDPLDCTDSSIAKLDEVYPLINWSKGIGTPVRTTASSLPNPEYLYQTLKYPDISFGYAKPGEDFVAKRNWWAFTVDAGGFDSDATRLARRKRTFVLSIYEIPSQLAISASAFMSLGQFASGDAWQNVTIDGGVFAGKAIVEGTTELNSISARRGLTLSDTATIGGQTFSSNPFAAGVRETYQVTTGKFFPVSLASETGRAVFVPINRGADYFDRFSAPDETNTVSPTTWNDYSIGARQCAMRLDITGIESSTNATPTRYRFSYYPPTGDRVEMVVPLDSSILATLPPGYTRVCGENQSYNFTGPVDVAYGERGGYTFRQGITGTVNFNNATFGDPLVGTVKSGYWRPRAPFENMNTPGGQKCIAVYPERFPTFLAAIGAATVSINNSLAVNVDYTTTGLNNSNRKPNIPCTSNDYGVILKECANLKAYAKGFSLVTNLRLYIGDDFNTVRYDAGGEPPCSLFTPEKRYGVDVDPFAVSLTGQIGSLARGDKINASDADPAMVRPLDSTGASGTALGAGRINVNLKPITRPGDLPPVYMMNWLVVLEERLPEFY